MVETGSFFSDSMTFKYLILNSYSYAQWVKVWPFRLHLQQYVYKQSFVEGKDLNRSINFDIQKINWNNSSN